MQAVEALPLTSMTPSGKDEAYRVLSLILLNPNRQGDLKLGLLQVILFLFSRSTMCIYLLPDVHRIAARQIFVMVLLCHSSACGCFACYT